MIMRESTDKTAKKMKAKFYFTHKQPDILDRLHKDPFLDFVRLRDDAGNTVLHFATNYNNTQAIAAYFHRLKDPAYWVSLIPHH